MHPITAIILGLALFFGLLFLSSTGNPCSQFSRHPEQCSGSV